MTEQSSDNRTNTWDVSRYKDDHSFVHEYGEALIEYLEPVSEKRVLVLGCGTGELTYEMHERGAEVIGIDNSEEMLAKAQANYPNCRFIREDARDFAFDDPFDAVFSNAVLHWIPDEDHAALLSSVSDALTDGGRFVAECGGVGNVRSIIDAVQREMNTLGYDIEHSWYFPSIGEYTPRLELHGFEVRYATLFDRPVDLDGGEEGLASWLRMFGDSLFKPLSEDEKEKVIRATEVTLRDELFDKGSWTADYRRLRFTAVLKDE